MKVNKVFSAGSFFVTCTFNSRPEEWDRYFFFKIGRACVFGLSLVIYRVPGRRLPKFKVRYTK